jgi:hypothetical protein
MPCAVCTLPHENQIRRDADVVIPRQRRKPAGEQTREYSQRKLA